ncbi:uncharacterized protein LOC126746602 [Anthonomus grandis grandis]|uniref:uncharacterized protein LOC126746602 n=1 Tax=Anthonomus grandis grandis TaxID=2921223 RepID=UPI002166C019|nr:uncharacterized protein LOC126746602 [Anthonomus grandis grandis]
MLFSRRYCIALLIIIYVKSIIWVECSVKYGNNACRTLEDYRTVYRNKNCTHNPDVGSSPRIIAKRYGYSFEKHQVITQDGYILTLHRIPSKNQSTEGRSQPVLIVHGLAGVSTFWIIQKKRSIAFFLSNNAYDVWLANLRGNYYSDRHVNRSISAADYWNFSFHENAIYDIPACIDVIAEKTGGRGDLIYIGHSMGTTISYIYSSLMSQHAEKNVKIIISLAPVAYMGHVKGAFGLLAPSAPFFANILRSKGIHALFEGHALQRLVLGNVCGKYPFIVSCMELIQFASGSSPGQLQPELIPVLFDIYPSAVSLKTFLHFSQLITSGGKFRMYDYGLKTNQLIYNSTSPPEYDVKKINIPIRLFVGTSDVVAPITDAKALADNLRQDLHRTYSFPYAHNDFFMGKHVDEFYKTLLDVIRMVLLVYWLILPYALAQHDNNVCSTYEAYFDNKNTNPKCWFDPDVEADQDVRAANHDLALEHHHVRTKDNWILTALRLKSLDGTYGKQPVLLMHGLGSDASQYTVNGNKSIAYFLARQGFDVWLGNFRGTEFSEHTVWTKRDNEFWDICIDDHGLQDLPSYFKYIKNKTKRKLIYMGHSMGGTAMGMYLSTEPDEAVGLIKHTIMLSPTFYMRDSKGIFTMKYIQAFYNLLPLVPSINVRVLFEIDSIERNFLLDFCQRSYKNLMLCVDLTKLIGGYGGYPLSPERLYIGFKVMKNYSFKDSFHYAQLIKTGEFRKFDYGLKGNLLRYNSTVPPTYDLSKMTTDMSWICGRYDSLATWKDCSDNFAKFKKPNWNIYKIEYNHINFLIDNRCSDKIMLPLLLHIMNKAR